MRNRWIGLLAAVLAGAASLAVWNRLPPEVATHWNLRGEPDDWSSRGFVAWFAPAMILLMTGVLQVLPRIDPRGKNYEKFRDVYWLIGNLVIVFLLVLHLAMLANGAGAPVDVTRVLAGSLGVLFVLLGNYLGRVKPNWFIGIRTPWTLDNPEVWRRTHRVGGWLFVAAGLVTVVCALVPATGALTVAFVGVMVAAVGSALLSLVFWAQARKGRTDA